MPDVGSTKNNSSLYKLYIIIAVVLNMPLDGQMWDTIQYLEVQLLNDDCER